MSQCLLLLKSSNSLILLPLCLPGKDTLVDLNISQSISTLNMTSEITTISGILNSFGQTNLSNTAIAGDLTVDGTFSITGGNTINAIETLFIQNNPLTKLVDFFNGKVTIDNSGKLAINTLTVSSSSLADGIIPSGQSLVTINNTNITAKSKVFITPTSNLDGNLIVYAINPGQGFTIKLTKLNS